MPTATAPDYTPLRATLEASLKAIKARIDPPDTLDLRAGGNGANESADYAATHAQHEDSLASRSRLLVQHRELVMAIGRMDDGSYGQCEACGEDIGAARLRAVPTATLCLADKQDQERRAKAVGVEG